MKKGRISLFILIILGVFTSCGKKAKASSANANLTLTLRAGVYANVIKQTIGDFEKENNVVCTVLELGEEELHQKIASEAGLYAGTYDLCMVDGSWVAEYTSKNMLANLKSLGFDLDDDVIPAYLKECA